jgi:hypothetical protein
MPRARRFLERELKVLELVASGTAFTEIMGQLDLTRSELSNVLHKIYTEHGIEGKAPNKRHRLREKLRPIRVSAHRVHLPLRSPAGPPLDGMDWEQAYWRAFHEVIQLEKQLEDDGQGGNRYWREAL